MTESVEKVALRRALSSALRFAASRSAITANEEKAILAAFDAQAALSAIPEGEVDSGFGGRTPELAEMLWANLPVGQREWSSLPTHEKALVCHTVQRLLAPAHARIAELEALLNTRTSERDWQGIESAPRDGTEFLSCGGPDNLSNKVQPTRWLSPGPYASENGKNMPGERRYQYPDGFYWAGYDGFVGPVHPTHWQPLPAPPRGDHLRKD